MIASLRLSLLSAVLLTSVGAVAQTAAAPSAKPDYSRESAVLEHYTQVYRYHADGTGVRETTAVLHVQDDASVKSWSVLQFGFASSHEHVEIDYIRVRRADGTIVETPAADAQEMPAPITRDAPFYSDLKEKQIPVRSLRVGDRLEYKIRIVSTRAEAPGHFWGEDSVFKPSQGMVVLDEVIELHAPKDAYLKVWSPKLPYTTPADPAEQVYRWQASQLHPLAGLDKAAMHKLLEPEATDGLGKLQDIAWTNFHDWAEVGAWYRSMEGTRIQPDDEIQSRVKELIADKKTDEEKVQALYNFVGPQVRYIGVAFGIGRYQPHEAADVLRNQYGDCKDKSTLLISMLAAAGIKADAALIGAGVRFNPDVPSPSAFNHCITLVHLGDRTVWLDSTAEVAPYGFLFTTIRGKQALVVPAEGASTIQSTPKQPPFPAQVTFTADGTLDEQGTSHSHITWTIRGDEEVLFRSAARAVSPGQWDEFIQKFSHAIGYAGTVSHAELSRPDLTADPMHVSYDYVREKSGDWDNHRIIAQLSPINITAVDEKDPPIEPLELGYVHVQLDHAVMKLPAGWGAELPTAIHAKSSFATLDKTFKLEDGKLISDRRLEILTERVPAADWKAYKKWYDEAQLDTEPFIQLTRTGGSRAAGVDNARAAELIREAVKLEQEHNLTAAHERVDEAKAINPQQAYLWSNYGYIAMLYGKPNEAVEDFDKEIAAHPDEDLAYTLKARALLMRSKSDEAETTLEKLLEHSPDNKEAVDLLAGLLMADKKYAALETLMRKRLAAKPEDVATQYSLGSALVREGKKDEGAKILTGVLEKASDPLMLNNAAYELANQKLELAASEKGARRALELLEEQVANAPENEIGRSAMLRTESILNVWDTLGWALYQEGKTAEAEPFVRAAWENSLASEPGYHLGMVLEKLGQPVKAMAVYQVAMFGDKGSDASVNLNNLERQQALQGAGTPKQVKDGKTELQNRRTFTVNVNDGHAGWGNVDINVSGTGVSGARVVGSSGDNLEAMGKAIAALNSVDFHLSVPPGSRARIVRQGILSCHAGKPCEVVLISSRDAINATPE